MTLFWVSLIWDFYGEAVVKLLGNHDGHGAGGAIEVKMSVMI